MKIKSVELMRNIRDRMSQETSGMTWHEEHEYLTSHISSFEALLKEVPNKRLQPTAQSVTRSARTTLRNG